MVLPHHYPGDELAHGPMARVCAMAVITARVLARGDLSTWRGEPSALGDGVLSTAWGILSIGVGSPQLLA